ncbi:MAG: T9SS type A sorting domain-containing protein [Pedobacter sp.]|nr:MAG: T9SS type A sorting domain-containing protein [Pedobacter sp.]
MKKALLVLLFPLFASAQTPSVSGIYLGGWNGESNFVSLSSDGQTIAVGGIDIDSEGVTFSRARIYSYNGNGWTQKGQTLEINDFSAGNLYPRSRVALSADGDIMAMASPSHGANANAGLARIYQFNGATWEQIGQDIIGAPTDYMGFDIALSAEGKIFAISASGTESDINWGNVTVYQYNGSGWQQMGQKLIGEADEIGAIDFFQSSVSLSADGTIMCIGYPFGQDEWIMNVNGQVRVYQYNGIIWQQVGETIINEEGYNLGWDVSLSSNGNFLAAGRIDYGYGIARVYGLTGGQWVQRGQDLIGDSFNDEFGTSVAISADGNILAVGAPDYGEGGRVKIFNFTGTQWQPAGESIDSNGTAFGSDLSMTPSGNYVAVSSPFSNFAEIYGLEDILDSNTFVKAGLSVYPNPTQKILNIELKDDIGLVNANIYDGSGKLMKTVETSVINVSDLSEGTYYIQVFTNKGKATKTFIKK